MSHVFSGKFADENQVFVATTGFLKFRRFHQLQAGVFGAEELPGGLAVRFGIDFGGQLRVQAGGHNQAVGCMHTF